MNKIKFKSIIFDSGLGVKFLISMIPRICQEKVRMLFGGKFTFESWKISFQAGKFYSTQGNFIPTKKIHSRPKNFIPCRKISFHAGKFHSMQENFISYQEISFQTRKFRSSTGYFVTVQEKN